MGLLRNNFPAPDPRIKLNRWCRTHKGLHPAEHDCFAGSPQTEASEAYTAFMLAMEDYKEAQEELETAAKRFASANEAIHYLDLSLLHCQYRECEATATTSFDEKDYCLLHWKEKKYGKQRAMDP